VQNKTWGILHADGREVSRKMSDLLYRKQHIFKRGGHHELRFGKLKDTSVQPVKVGLCTAASHATCRDFSDLALEEIRAGHAILPSMTLTLALVTIDF